MKTVVRNNNKEEETEVLDTWYVIISRSELEEESFRSPLFSCKDEAISEATEEYDETMYVAEVKLITKVVG